MPTLKGNAKTKAEKRAKIRELAIMIRACDDPEVKARLRRNMYKRRYALTYYDKHPEAYEELKAKRKRARHNRAKKKYHKRKRLEARRERERTERARLREIAKELRAEERRRESARRAEERRAAAEEKRRVEWMVVTAVNNKITRTDGRFKERGEAAIMFEGMRRRLSAEPEFPKAIRNHCGFDDYKNEVLLLRCKDRVRDKSNRFLRNEYGELVEHEITGEKGEKWLIWNKFRYREEETFSFAPGQEHYHSGRKTFGDIWREFVIEALDSCDGFVGIQKYRNKIIFRDGFRASRVVFCKTKDEADRLMRKLTERGSNRKLRGQVVFMDEVASLGDASRVLDELTELTGYSRERIKRITTQH